MMGSLRWQTIGDVFHAGCASVSPGSRVRSLNINPVPRVGFSPRADGSTLRAGHWSCARRPIGRVRGDSRGKIESSTNENDTDPTPSHSRTTAIAKTRNSYVLALRPFLTTCWYGTERHVWSPFSTTLRRSSSRRRRCNSPPRTRPPSPTRKYVCACVTAEKDRSQKIKLIEGINFTELE